MSAVYTIYDGFTDAEFAKMLELRPNKMEMSELLASAVKRLTADRQTALYDARSDGYNEGVEVGAAEAIADFQRDRPESCEACGAAIEYND
jgi:hypothetical protein